MFAKSAGFSIGVTMLLLIAGGCGTPRGPYSPMQREDGKEPHQFSHGVTMLDKNVRSSLLFINRTAKRLPNGQIVARVQMQSIHPGTIWSDVRFVFYDADKMAIDKSEWQATAFPSREVVLIQGISLRQDTETYNIQFKNLRSKSGQPKLITPAGSVAEHGLWRDSVLPE